MLLNASLSMAGGLKLDDLQCPFQPKPLYNSMIKHSFPLPTEGEAENCLSSKEQSYLHHIL